MKLASFLSENMLEDAACEALSELGWRVENWHQEEDNPKKERGSFTQPLLEKCLAQAIQKLNPDMPEKPREEALTLLRRPAYHQLILENERLHKLLTKGVPVTVRKPDGVYKNEYAAVIDFQNPSQNDFLAIRQLWMEENNHKRRADIGLFINGMLLGLIELKSPSSDHDIEQAYNQLQTYKAELPAFFRFNEILIISDGLTSRIGSLTADFRRFMRWRTLNGQTCAPGENLDILLKGVCAPETLLNLILNGIAFKKEAKETAKILLGYHQYWALKKAVPSILEAYETSGKGGVIWHTQGAGKSLLMAFLAHALTQQKTLENPTILVLTDRNDLDNQLFSVFCSVQDFLGTAPRQADTREDLRRLLRRETGGIIFSTLQKFSLSEEETKMPLLSERHNIIVLADEAHRSQYGLSEKIDSKNGKMRSPLAKNIREALPNAVFTGFTGTPLEKEDKSTPGLFGDYIDIYDISRAIEDQVTVPVYYEPHVIPVNLDKNAFETAKNLAAETKEEDWDEHSAYLQMEKLMGASERLEKLATHLISHFETRQASQEVPGKGLIVGFSRTVCAALYNKIIEHRPSWHDEADDKGAIKVVMTGTASDGPELAKHKSTKQRLDLLGRRLKNPDDPLKLVIVRDMWLTGFDAPCLNVLYVDKPMKEHGLMQAVARVNRVFPGKNAGLVVDYVGIAAELKKALLDYAKNSDDSRAEEIGIDIGQAVAEMQKRFQIVYDIFSPESPSGFDYRPALNPELSPQARLQKLGGAVEHILALRQKEIRSAGEDTQKQKTARNRYKLAVKALRTAWALVPATPEAQAISKDLGFFLAVAAQIDKSAIHAEDHKSRFEIDLAIRSLMNQAIHADETVDLLALMGIERPEVDMLSEAFLQKLSNAKQRNLAAEALEKLLSDRILKLSSKNQTKGQDFFEKLKMLVNRYNTGHLTAAEMLAELIKQAKELNHSIEEMHQSGFSPEEIAFYDALRQNKSAAQALKEPVLRKMAEELVKIVQRNATVDWMRTEQGRAKMRLAVKRLLKKYKYPPDQEQQAITRIIAQAELNAQNSVSGV